MQAPAAGGHRVGHRQQVNQADTDGLGNGQGGRRLRGRRGADTLQAGWGGGTGGAQTRCRRVGVGDRRKARLGSRSGAQWPPPPAWLTKEVQAPVVQVQRNLQRPMQRSSASGGVARCPLVATAARGVAAFCCCSSCAISCMRSVRMGWRRPVAGEGAASGDASIADGARAPLAAARASSCPPLLGALLANWAADQASGPVTSVRRGHGRDARAARARGQLASSQGRGKPCLFGCRKVRRTVKKGRRSVFRRKEEAWGG